MFAKNYIISNSNWMPLSDIMNQDYDHTVPYKLHTNEISRGKLRLTHRTETPAEDEVGREYDAYCEICLPIDEGDNIYLKVVHGSINVEIREDL